MRKYIMSWEGKPNYRWVKMYRGTRYRVSCQDLHLPRELWTKELSYQFANDWWNNLCGARIADLRGRLLTSEAQIGQVKAELKAVLIEEGMAKVKVPLALEDKRNELRDEIIAEVTSEPVHIPTPKTLAYQREQFLSICRLTLKPKSYKELADTLALISTQLGGDTFDCSTLSEGDITNLFRWLKGTSYQPATSKKMWGMLRRFVRFLFQSNVCNLPRNLDSKEFKFGVKPKAITQYPLELVRAELKALPKRLRLYALLALNCGFRNSDIAQVKRDQYDGHRIVHKRVKTDKFTDVPVVSFKLWPQTIKAIEEGKAKKGDLLFTTQAGTPLVEYRFEGDMVRNKDMIIQQWRRGQTNIPLSAYRSIGATIIGGHREYGRYAPHYLGHSPTSIADKHYIAPSAELFDEIMDWLGKQVLGAPKAKRATYTTN